VTESAVADATVGVVLAQTPAKAVRDAVAAGILVASVAPDAARRAWKGRTRQLGRIPPVAQDTTRDSITVRVMLRVARPDPKNGMAQLAVVGRSVCPEIHVCASIGYPECQSHHGGNTAPASCNNSHDAPPLG
jgi:hypothetical protein